MRFSEIIGQKRIKRHLTHGVDNNRISHAQLFTGKAGSGALALAVAYAQYIHCPNRSNGDSCGVCPHCQQIAALAHPDLHFVFPINKMGKKSGAVGFAVYLDLLEELNETKREYDIDAVILYDAATDLSSLTKAVKSLSESGKSVVAQKCVPEKLKYRQLYKMNESEVELLEDNA